MSPGTWRLVGLGAAAFVAAVVMTLPARVAWSWVAPEGVDLHNSSGSVWNGRADGVSVSGVPLGAPAWDVSLLTLFTGRAAWDVTLDRPDGFLNTRVALPLTGSAVEFHDAEGALPLRAVEDLFPISPQDSAITLRVERLRLEGGWPVILRGTVSVTELPVRGIEVPLGPFQADFPDAGDGPPVGILSSVGGPLDIDGRLELGADRTWLIEGTAAPGGEAPASLTRGLGALGPADSAGRRPFSLSGSF
jgi:hypothetical protein